MTKAEIMRMAKDAGATFEHMTWVERDLTPVFERFAHLIAAAEREACAAILDANANRCVFNSTFMQLLKSNAVAIRARGQE